MGRRTTTPRGATTTLWNDERAAGDDGATRPGATGAINTASANNGVRFFNGGHHGPHYNEGGGDGYHRFIPRENLHPHFYSS